MPDQQLDIGSELNALNIDSELAALPKTQSAQQAPPPTAKPKTDGMFMADEDWAALPINEKIRNVLGFGGKVVGGMIGGSEGVKASEHPAMTLGTAAIPIVGKYVPGAIARMLGISSERAAQNIQQATQAAKDVPLNVEKVGQEGLRAMELQQAGARMPRAATQIMRRITDPAQAEMTFGEGRDYYSNLSRLSANEQGTLNPTMQRQLIAMRQALHDALVGGADEVGMGGQYARGIREYARAAKAANMGKEAAAVAGKAAGLGAMGGAGWWLLNALGGGSIADKR